MKKKIIILSGKQHSGKDTVAKILLEEFKDFKRVALGDAIKLEYGKQKGLTYEEIEKNKPLYRPDLIALGDAGRAKDPDFWIKKIIDLPYNIVVTDVRMKRELEIFEQEGAFTIRVNAPKEQRAQRGTLVKDDDETETQLDEIKSWNHVIENDSSYEELVQKSNVLIKHIKEFFKKTNA